MSALFLGSHKVFKKSNHYPWPNVINKNLPSLFRPPKNKENMRFCEAKV